MYKFKLTILFLFVLLLFQNKVISQNYILDDFFLNIQWIIFKVPNDSIYKITKNINQEGYFYFNRGFVDTSLIAKKNKSNIVRLESKKNNYKKYKLRYRFIENIDTLQSIFPTNNSFNVLPKEIVIKRNKRTKVYYYEDIFLDEVRFSYILRQLGEEPIYNSDKDEIRVLFPVNKNDYQMGRIVLNDTSKLYLVFGKSEDSLGIRDNERVSYLLEESDVERIKKRLSKINSFSSLNCTRPGDRYLVEYNYNSEYKRFFVSFDCLSGKKEFREVDSFCNYILSFVLGIKYKRRYKSKSSTIPDK